MTADPVQPDPPLQAPPAVPLATPQLPWWRRAARLLYVVAVLAAFTVAIIARRRELADSLSGLDPLPLVASVVAGLVGVGISGMVWRSMITGLGGRMPLWAAIRVFFVAQLGKYLPGSVWPILAQAEMARESGIPRRTAVAGQTLFMWVHLITGAIIGLPVLAAVGLLPTWVALTPLTLVPLLVPRPLVWVMNRLLAVFGRTPLPAHPSGGDMLRACAWAVAMWILYGMHIHFAVDAFEFTAPGLLPVIAATGVFAAAWSAGFLFLIAPAGAGARELVLIAGLSTVASPETALAVTLLSRLVLSLADGLWGGVGVLAGVGGVRTAAARSGVDSRVDGGPGNR